MGVRLGEGLGLGFRNWETSRNPKFQGWKLGEPRALAHPFFIKVFKEDEEQKGKEL